VKEWKVEEMRENGQEVLQELTNSGDYTTYLFVSKSVSCAHDSPARPDPRAVINGNEPVG
jgi:hypothetical protein